METTVDPYELQLLAVFNSCDESNEGSLDSNGLSELCEKLQLGENRVDFINCLLGSSVNVRVTFQEFRDGLLRFLNSREGVDHSQGDVSPVREVSPKYVCGKKKYGRRSRPESGEVESNDDITYDEGDSETFLPNNSEQTIPQHQLNMNIIKKKRPNGVHMPSSTSCIESGSSHYSAGDSCNISLDNNSSNSMLSVVDSEECLREAWLSFASTEDCMLGKEDVLRVCRCLSDDSNKKVVEDLINKLRLNEVSTVSFNTFSQCWRLMTSRPRDDLEPTPKESNSLTSLDVTQKGYVSGATLVDQWEGAGVPGAAQLLHDLGYSTSNQVNLPSLINIMESELKALRQEDKLSKNLNVHLALLDANLVLQRLYVFCLKSTIEHMSGEKEKLKSDIVEANQRAFLLAQEVDDHHLKLEKSSREQMRLLEQRHNEQIRELTSQLKCEQEQMSMQNTILEQKLLGLQQDENNYKLLITRLESDYTSLEQEHRNIVEQLNESEIVRKKLEKDLESLAGLQDRLCELEGSEKERDVQMLLDKIHLLQVENSDLRDRNDELTMEVEDLTTKLASTCIKRSSNSPSPPYNMAVLDVTGCAVKRRGDSPKCDESSGEEDSPRLGKVRRCNLRDCDLASTVNLQGLQIHQTNSENSDECVEVNKHEGLADLMDFEENKLLQGDIVPFSEELKQALNDKNPSMTSEKCGAGKKCQCEPCNSEKCRRQKKNLLFDERNRQESEELKSKIENLKLKLKTVRDESELEKLELTNRCCELESSVELLKIEYERTEDYWSKKLEDERMFFDQEQKLSDEKYTELLNKIMDYEDMITNEKNRLDTIDERASLEGQVADIEEDYENRKKHWEMEILEKDKKIKELEEQISKYFCDSSSLQANDVCVQVQGNETCDSDVGISSASSFGQVSSYSSKQDTDLNDRSNMKKTTKKSRMYYKRDIRGGKTFYYNPNEQLAHINMLQDEINCLKEAKTKYQQDCTLLAKQRDIMYSQMVELKQRSNSSRDHYLTQQCNNYFIETATGPIGNNPNMMGRVKYLEQKCQHLTVNLKKQHKQTQDIISSAWKQHREEVLDLKDVLKSTEDKLKQQTGIIQEQLRKLAHTDVLVKDLFVENACLLSSIQKLEKIQHQQCYQCNQEKIQHNFK